MLRAGTSRPKSATFPDNPKLDDLAKDVYARLPKKVPAPAAFDPADTSLNEVAERLHDLIEALQDAQVLR